MKILSQNFLLNRTIRALEKLVEFANLQNTNCEQSSCVITELKLTPRQHTHFPGRTAECGGETLSQNSHLKKISDHSYIKHESNQGQTALKFYTGLFVFQCCLLRSEGDCQTCQRHFTFKGREWHSLHTESLHKPSGEEPE